MGAFYEEVGPIPVRWEIWMQVLTVYLLYELTPFRTWMGGNILLRGIIPLHSLRIVGPLILRALGPG